MPQSKTNSQNDLQPHATQELEKSDRYLGRDLSWLAFNQRVLEQALDEQTQLLERVKFLAIFTSNLDEFFMKRVALLKRQVDARVDFPSLDGLSASEQLKKIRQCVCKMHEIQTDLYENCIFPALAEAGIKICHYETLDKKLRQQANKWFVTDLYPVLTPLAVDSGHQFPFISNLSDNLAVLLGSDDLDEPLFARVKVPRSVPRYVTLCEDDPVLVPVDEIVSENLELLFPGLKILDVVHFRITRSAGLQDEEDETENMLLSVEAELKKRRFARAVRLEVPVGSSRVIVSRLRQELKLSEGDIYERSGPIEYLGLYEIADMEHADLKDPVWAPIVPTPISEADGDIMRIMRERDLLVHHPYESFNATVVRFISQASRDPDVLAIKQTLYRTSRDSPFIESLIRAAESGKQVACLVELRARFDESRNVRLARMLEKAGVHVAYGVPGLKTHCKTSLVVRKEHDGVRCYAHLGTGNYHPKTAQLYTDLGLLTCDLAITQDVVRIFNHLTGYTKLHSYNRLLIAPATLRNGLMDRLKNEIDNAKAGKPARFFAKVNSLEDKLMIDALYEASAAGVKIDLAVRGFCCLRAGIKGLSENIRVISVIGRFLEHSRIFHFADGCEDPLDGQWFIGSADIMYRNLNNRVEAICPINDTRAKARLVRIMDVLMADHKNAWIQNPDGSYIKRTPTADADPLSPHAVGTFATMMWDAKASTLRSD